MKHIILLLLVVVSHTAAAQYAKLLERYNAFDTTLTLEDHRALYYEFVSQPAYSAAPALKQKEINAAITKRDFANVVVLCDAVLKTYPVSLTANFAKGLALASVNPNDTVYGKYLNRYATLLRAIASSGDGKTAKTAFKVIFIADEYEMIHRYFGITQAPTQKTEGTCDVFDVVPSEKWRDKKIYFNASAILKKENEFKK